MTANNAQFSADYGRGEPTLRVLSLGGGTQSCALALMSAAGDLPKLDHIVFADTQGELPETYAYLDYLRSVVEPAGIPLHVVTAGNLEAALINGAREAGTTGNPTPPAYVINEDGSKGRIGNYKCSFDFKRRIVTQKVKQLCGGRGAWKSASVEQWIGFSQDEMSRMKQSEECRCGHARVKRHKGAYQQVHTSDGCLRCACKGFEPWQVNRWPLIELGMKRSDTIKWFGDNGHPTPPRSACWFCPNSGNARWRSLKAEHPDLFERACAIDEAIRNVSDFRDREEVTVAVGLDPKQRLLSGEMFLHVERVPLRVADLRSEQQRRQEDHGEYPLFDLDALAADCDAGTCFT